MFVSFLFLNKTTIIELAEEGMAEVGILLIVAGVIVAIILVLRKILGRSSTLSDTIKTEPLHGQASHIKNRKKREPIENLRNIVFFVSTTDQDIMNSPKLTKSLQHATGVSSIRELPGHSKVDFIAGQSNLSKYEKEIDVWTDFHVAGSIISKNEISVKESILNGRYYGWVDYFFDSEYGQAIAVYFYEKENQTKPINNKSKVRYSHDSHDTIMGQKVLYKHYNASNKRIAREWLEEQTVSKIYVNLVVETPEGGIAKDINGIYEE